MEPSHEQNLSRHPTGYELVPIGLSLHFYHGHTSEKRDGATSEILCRAILMYDPSGSATDSLVAHHNL